MQSYFQKSQNKEESENKLSAEFKTTFLSRLIVDHPEKIVFGMTALMSLLIFITVHFGIYKQSEQTLRDYLVWNSQITLEFDKKVAAETEISRLNNLNSGIGDKSGNYPPRSVEVNSWNAIILYHQIEETEDKNLWTPKSLGAIQQIEADLLNSPEYQDFCPSLDPENGDFSCSKQSIYSVIEFMVKETGKQQLNTSTQAELDDALKRLIVKRQTWPKIKNLFD